jgi:3,4-dihydroxy 2-butanone 4-phosphate synthase/GTP cyclohydrolase II
LAGLAPAAVICEIINEDGSMARRPDLERFSKQFGIPLVTIEDLINEISSHSADLPLVPGTASSSVPETLQLLESASTKLPTVNGFFQARSFRQPELGVEHLFLQTPQTKSHLTAPLVRIHSECLTGDVFGSKRCDCGPQLQMATQQIMQDSKAGGGGGIIYLRNHEGRGIGLFNKICAYALQDQGLDTVEANETMGFEADARGYQDAVQILKQMKWTRIRLLTNNPRKVEALQKAGIEVVERVPLQAPSTPENEGYLSAKQTKFQHWLGRI